MSNFPVTATQVTVAPTRLAFQGYSLLGGVPHLGSGLKLWLTEQCTRGLSAPENNSQGHHGGTGRADAQIALTETLTTVDVGGCIVVGAPGAGKTTFVQHVLASLPGEVCAVAVRGMAFSARIKCGALAFLLSELDAGASDSPGTLLDGLKQLLAPRARGRCLVFVVDNAEHVDDMSAVVLSQFVLNGDAKLILLTEDCGRMPGDFTGLWRTGVLRRCDLDSVSFTESELLLAEELGGPVSEPAAFKLWRESEGNPLFLKALARDCVDGGKLLLHDGTWVLASGNVVRGRHVLEEVGERLAGLATDQYKALEIFALLGSVPLHSLPQGAAAGADILQEHGLLDITHEPHACGRLRSHLIADVVRQRMDVSRRAEIHGSISPATAVAGTATLLRWAEPPADEAEAEDFSRMPASVALETAWNLMRRWKPREAAELLSGFRTTNASRLGLKEWGRLALAESRARRRLHDMSAARNLLEEVGRELNNAARHGHGALPARREMDILNGELLLARIEIARYEGRFGDISQLMADASAGLSATGPQLRVQTSGWLCEAWAMTGRQNDALELADALLPMLDDPALTEESRGLCALQLANAYTMAGAWKQARLMFEGRSGKALAPDRAALGSEGQLAAGLFWALAEAEDRALQCLLPALTQLQVWDPDGFLPLATAAAAWCLALQGEFERSSDCLAEVTIDAGSTRERERRTRYFVAAARSALGEQSAAAAQFRRLAEDERAAGSAAWEMLALFSAARTGDLGSARRLAEVAAVVEGNLADVCQVYAKGLLNDDSQLLIQTVERASDTGHLGLARRIGDNLLEALLARGDRAAAKDLKRIMRTLAQSSPSETSGDEVDCLDGLTKRQRQIVHYVRQGANNREIATKTGVSVRTVEGHLYQIYLKLQVRNRRELAALDFRESL